MAPLPHLARWIERGLVNDMHTQILASSRQNSTFYRFQWQVCDLDRFHVFPISVSGACSASDPSSLHDLFALNEQEPSL